VQRSSQEKKIIKLAIAEIIKMSIRLFFLDRVAHWFIQCERARWHEQQGYMAAAC